VAETWVIKYWGQEDGSSSVEKWLDERTPQQLKTVAKEIKLLERCGNKLRLPHSRALGEGLFELRERVHGYRIYYAFIPGRNIVVLHAGDKGTQKNDIKIARERLTMSQQRAEV
jgi:putative addiction module killer protein